MAELNEWVSDQLYALIGECRMLSSTAHAFWVSLHCAQQFLRCRHTQCHSPRWCSQHDPPCAGLADGATVSFSISMAKRASSVAALAVQLQGVGLPASGATYSFAADLLARVPRPGQAPAISTYKQQEKADLIVARKNRCVHQSIGHVALA